MINQSSRRTFLQSALTAAVVGGTSLAGRPTPAAGPVQRNGKPHLKLSLAAYSYRDYLTGKPKPRMTLDQFIELCADLGLDGTELTSYYFPENFDQAYLVSLKHKTFRLGLDISGTAIANDFCLPPGEAREKSLAHTRLWIDHAATMGAPVIRIFAGTVPQGDSDQAAIERCAAGIN
ncbi:MAG: sugar phosphate isomerase/epimerase family protein, partial [Planctomycetaceae bacterium]